MMIVKNFARRLWYTYRGFQEHDGMLSAAGIAYYVALSFFPLFLVLLAGLGWDFTVETPDELRAEVSALAARLQQAGQRAV